MADVLNVLANLTIVAGYLLVPAIWLPYLPLTRFVRASGTLFFATCAITHIGMAFGWTHFGWMLVNHVIQAIAVMCFVLGFGKHLHAAATRKEALRMAAEKRLM